MGIINALMSLVSKWFNEPCLTNSNALKKWYVWLSGSKTGMTRAKNKLTPSKIKNAIDKRIKLLSKRSEFLNLLKSKSGLRKFIFLNLKIENVIIKFKIEKIKTFVLLIALNKDKISIFKITRAKNERKNIKKVLKIDDKK